MVGVIGIVGEQPIGWREGFQQIPGDANVSNIAGRQGILHRVGIDAEPMRVFEALTTIEGIRNWWTSQAEGDAAEGEGRPEPRDIPVAVGA